MVCKVKIWSQTDMQNQICCIIIMLPNPSHFMWKDFTNPFPTNKAIIFSLGIAKNFGSSRNSNGTGPGGEDGGGKYYVTKLFELHVKTLVRPFPDEQRIFFLGIAKLSSDRGWKKTSEHQQNADVTVMWLKVADFVPQVTHNAPKTWIAQKVGLPNNT